MIELLFLNGSRNGQRVRITGERITIGSKRSNTIIVEDPSIAPKHAVLMRGRKGYSIIIHESKPPVAVNGKQIIREFLKDGDKIRFGDIEAKYFAPNEKEDQRPAAADLGAFKKMLDGTANSSAAGTVEDPLSLDDEEPFASADEPKSRRSKRATKGGKNWRGILIGLLLLGIMLGGSLLIFRKELWKPQQKHVVENDTPTKEEDTPPPPKDPKEPPKDDPKEPAIEIAPLGFGAGPSGLKAGAKIHRTSKFKSHQEAVDAAAPGDSVIFDTRDDKPIEVKKQLVDVQFISGSSKWEIHADVIDCQFILHEMPEFIQKAGRLEHCVFYRCPMKNTHLIYSNTVSMYFDEHSPLHPKDNGEGGKRPILQLTGFVKNVLIHKPFSGIIGADKRFDMNWEPSIRIYATDPEGDGRGSYILSPVVMGQRAWTPHQIARGNRITYAHLTADHASWADPVLDISRGNDCVVLCTSIGAETPATPEMYSLPPKKLKYAEHEEYGHDAPGPAYRGPVICIQGQRNRIVGHGAPRKAWTVGRKSLLPGFHYSDGIVAADPFLRQFATETGGLSINFAEHKAMTLMNPGKKGAEFLSSPEDANGAPKYPIDGANLIQPVLLPLKDLRINAGGFEKLTLQDLTGKPVDEIEKALTKDASIYLGPGTYEFKKTLTSGFVVGAGMEKTILKFPASVDCAQRSCRGLINCTVSGGKFGYNSQAGVGAKTGNPNGLFLRTRFADQKEACVNLHTTQFQTWQDCEFINAKFGFTHGQEKTAGVYKGDKGAAGGVTIDNLSLCNCTFRQMLNRGVDLAPDSVKLGHVAIHNCSFEDIGDSAIVINGGQTHLVQQCAISRCGRGSYAAAINITSNSAVALSHLKIDCGLVKGNPVCVLLHGNAVVSQCEFRGMKNSLKCEGTLAADHITADAGVQAPKDSLLCHCRFKNTDLPEGISLAKEDGSFVDVTASASAPGLDKTPPPEVEFKVRANKMYRKVEWSPVQDPESGIVQYIIYAEDKEIGRTPFLYEPPSDAHSPTMKPVYSVSFNDPNPNNRGYRVVAVNGAGLTSEGKEAVPRRWGPARARFNDKEGNEIIWTRFSEVKGKINGVIDQENKPVPLAQVGKAGMPNVVYFDPGRLFEP
jgi:hypothetical protein